MRIATLIFFWLTEKCQRAMRTQSSSKFNNANKGWKRGLPTAYASQNLRKDAAFKYLNSTAQTYALPSS